MAARDSGRRTGGSGGDYGVRAGGTRGGGRCRGGMGHGGGSRGAGGQETRVRVSRPRAML